MATGKILKREPVTVEVYQIIGNSTTNISLGAGFRGFAVTSAYATDDLVGIYGISTNAAGNACRIKTMVAAEKLTISVPGAGNTIGVVNTSSNTSILMLFRNLAQY